MSRRRKFLILAGLVLIGVSLWNILPDYLDKRTSSQIYEDLREDYTEIPEGEDTEKKKDWWLTDVLIRFDELKEQNPDIVAWIRSDNPESTGIDYLVLYSGDNEKYLRRDLYGEEHIAGSIFLEGLNQPDFTDYYTILYGHNMNDGSMFGGLKKYKEKEFWEDSSEKSGKTPGKPRIYPDVGGCDYTDGYWEDPGKRMYGSASASDPVFPDGQWYGRGRSGEGRLPGRAYYQQGSDGGDHEFSVSRRCL